MRIYIYIYIRAAPLRRCEHASQSRFKLAPVATFGDGQWSSIEAGNMRSPICHVY